MLDENTKIWLNGKITDLKSGKVSLLTHSLHYGSSIFDGIRCYPTKKGSAIFRLEEHIERFFHSAKCMNMKLKYTKEEVKKACKKVIKLNNLKEAYIRPVAFYGEGMGLDPTNIEVNVAVFAWGWGQYLQDEIKVKIVKIKRISSDSHNISAKIGGHYVNSITATLEAKKQKYDEALLLDLKGNIAEGPGANIFFIKNSILYTPKKTSILCGITRDSIIKISKSLNYKVVEKDIKPLELKVFDSAFFVGTAVEVASISQIDKCKFECEKVEEIKKEFLKIVKCENEKFKEWLDFV